ncbi:PAS domain S-box-containing protein [Paenibacillus phyllosphaerae]|uniref:histidine kinase n=1 Tax=Paenibacillus phyllosphaerae TaxID=274593 RepID=A0A7W5B2J7_9BACL|nr:PAS domain S-box protein [Paenibacillus phyllosphaerae]MBB3113265.1 PAS domain S-box-containing protein [Paenibacillus phyllosphaerae]
MEKLPFTDGQRYLSRLDHLMETLDIAIVSNDILHNTISVSPSILAITGYPPEHFWHAPNWTKLIIPEDLPVLHQAREDARAHLPSICEYRIRTKAGELKWLQIRTVPIEEEGKANYYESIVVDITIRKRKEQEIALQERRYRSLFENNRDLVMEFDLEGNLKAINKDTVALFGATEEELLGAPICQFLLDSELPKIEEMFAAARSGHSPSVEVLSTPIHGVSLLWSVTCAPIILNGELQGIYAICRDITEQRHLECQLKESIRLFHLLTEHMSDVISIVSAQGGAIFISPSLGHVLGYAADEFMASQPYQYVYAEDAPVAREAIAKVVATGLAHEIRLRYVHKQGHLVDMELKGAPIFDKDGKVVSIVVVARDISAKVYKEKLLEESERRYRSLVEYSPQAIGAVRNGKLVFLNKAAAELLGAATPQEALACPIEYFLPDGMTADALETLELDKPFEMKIRRLDGRLILIEARKGYEPETETEEYIFHDISERKQAELALKESEERYRQLFELSPDAVMVVKDKKLAFINPAAIRLLGASSKEELIGYDVFGLIDNTYKASTHERMRQLEQGNRAELTELRLLRLDGSGLDIEVTSSPISFNGDFAYLSVVRDITARKRMEEEKHLAELRLKESEERFQRLQIRLDRFSKDLFSIMSVHELEQRLLQEIQEVLAVEQVQLLTLDGAGRCIVEKESYPHQLCRYLEENNPNREIGELNDCEEGHYVYIGNFHNQEHVLYLSRLPMRSQHESKLVWLKTMIRYVNNIYDNFKMIEDLTAELKQTKENQQVPAWFSRFLFTLSEKERKSLAQDLHDSALQEQIIWYRKLDMLLSEGGLNENSRDELERIREGLLDVVYQIRLTCNELRPPLLKELGLVPSLQQLFEITQLRSDYTVEFEAVRIRDQLNDELALSIYRIVQELLANASKHSNASVVRFQLVDDGDSLRLLYADNGIGMKHVTTAANGSMGLSGIQERARSLNGTVRIEPDLRPGLSISIHFPTLWT